MQIKASFRFHLTPGKMTKIEKKTGNKCCFGCWKKEPLFPIGTNANWCIHNGYQCGGASESYNLAHDPFRQLLKIILLGFENSWVYFVLIKCLGKCFSVFKLIILKTMMCVKIFKKTLYKGLNDGFSLFDVMKLLSSGMLFKELVYFI